MSDRLVFSQVKDKSSTQVALYPHGLPLPTKITHGLLRDRAVSERTIANIVSALAHPLVTTDFVRQAISEFQTGRIIFDLVENTEAANKPFRVYHTLTSTEYTEYGTFQEAIQAAPKTGIIRWDDVQSVCCLDIDNCAQYGDSLLSRLLRNLCPAPAYYWRSKSGGIHCIYAQLDGIPADESAAIAGFYLQSRSLHLARIEIKKDTAAPPGEYVCQTQTAGKATLGDAEGNTVLGRDAWLADRDFIIGQDYEHSRCPFNPSNKGNGKPVKVRGNYVYCAYCAERNPPGKASYAKLTNTKSQNLLSLCVNNFTHWGHARYILREVAENEKIGRLLYAAMLRQKWGDDPRIAGVFTASEPIGLLRKEGYWTTTEGESIRLDKGSSLLASLPVCQYVDDGKIKVDRVRHEMLTQSIDLTKIGYPPLVTVWGIQLTQFQQLPENKIYVLQHSASLRGPSCELRRPKYLLPDARLSSDDAWTEIERAFPGIERNAVRLLIAAKACSEHRSGLPPMVFLTGPTGSGKSATIEVASAICGDSVGVVQYANTTERLRQGLMDSKKQGGFAFFDEYIKGASREKQSAVKAMEIVLGFTPNSMSHALYVGHVSLGELPVCVWADTAIPPKLEGHAQIGRRIYHVPFYGEQDWEKTLANAGIREPKLLRVNGSEDIIHAANSILSEVIDEYFPLGSDATDFATVAESLGYRKLRDSDIARERNEIIAQFFRAICNATPISGIELARWGNAGWKRIETGREDCELTQLWQHLSDGDKPTSSIIEECSLQKLLHLRCAARFECRSHGRMLVVRFRSVGITPEVYNGDLLELEPRQSSIDGPGNSERVQPETRGSEEISSASVNAVNECSIFG
jgi:hypothetical protein